MSWVVFDYGGVISQHQPATEVARLASAARCPEDEFTAAYWAHRLGYDTADLDAATFWQRVAATLGRSFTSAQVAELTRLDIESWLHLQEPTVALIEQVAAAGHRLALLSNAPADVAGAITALAVAGHFEHLVFSCFLRSAKPDPACFGAALSQLGAAAGEVVFLDDRAENVAAATALGIQGVHFTGPAEARAELSRQGVLAG